MHWKPFQQNQSRFSIIDHQSARDVRAAGEGTVPKILFPSLYCESRSPSLLFPAVFPSRAFRPLYLAPDGTQFHGWDKGAAMSRYANIRHIIQTLAEMGGDIRSSIIPRILFVICIVAINQCLLIICFVIAVHPRFMRFVLFYLFFK